MSGVTEQMIESASAAKPAENAGVTGPTDPSIITARNLVAGGHCDIGAAVDWVMRQRPGVYTFDEAMSHVKG